MPDEIGPIIGPRSGITLERRTGPVKAECEGCEWRGEDVTYLRVRTHVKKTGHAVAVTVEYMTVYRPSETESKC